MPNALNPLEDCKVNSRTVVAAIAEPGLTFFSLENSVSGLCQRSSLTETNKDDLLMQ